MGPAAVVPFAPAFFDIAAAFALPSFLGLVMALGASRLAGPRYLAAFSFGLYFWFFSDTLGDSAYLGLNSGFEGGTAQAALLLLFASGLVLVMLLDRRVFEGGDGNSHISLLVPSVMALALGIHGIGEGAAFGAVAAQSPTSDLLSAFGGTSPALAFLLHKFLEPIMIGTAYATYAGQRARSGTAVAKDLLFLTVIFCLPGVVGAWVGYYQSFDATNVFALGLGASFYAPLRLARPLFWETNASKWGSVIFALVIMLGFLSLYFAGLFHA